ncbi:MAG TPA: SDR family NAD(P)-dependent oxidoreductase [Candidatus Methylomirabilis sp.]|nr:SDR family NAD(P)-dependent oxidoreductase [Candidatus Methylomirabilis sp.]
MTQSGTRLSNKIAIVTGAGAGIGRAIALRFGEEGAHVVVNDINAASADGTTQAIVAAGGSASGVVADVADKAQVDRLFDVTLERFKTIDVLVNNASLTHTSRHFLEADEQWWDRILAVNLKSAFLCALRAAQVMARRRQGSIINMSSGGASRAHRGNAAYDAAKGGVEALTRALALDLGPYGVRVNALVPGSINSKDLDEATLRERGRVMPLGRVGDVTEMAGPAVFLASDDASYITGHLLVVDGGLLAQQRSAPVDIFPLTLFPKLD